MDPTPKPSGYGRSSSGFDDDDRRVQSPKPQPPTHFNFGPSTSRIPHEKNDSDLRGFTVVEHPKEGTTRTDFGVRDVFNVVKSLDANRYATKKTIAQGMLDIALLTANASQLKYILQVGKQHEFYTLMLTLICVSIGLQILSGLLSLSLNLMRDRRMEDAKYAFSVEWIGRARVALSFIVFLDNIMISAFDPMGLSSLLVYDSPLPGMIFVLLGSSFNINKTQDQHKANLWNNVSVALMVLTVAVNVVISAFEMRDSNNVGSARKLDDEAFLQSPGIR